jgi:GNAT superfamily N-acetyltransferase
VEAPDPIRLRPARALDGPRLREIAVAAKGHWGYDMECVRAWGDEITVVPKEGGKDIVVAEDADGSIVGWASAEPRDDAWWLEDLWVDPGRMRAGVGSRLFREAARIARSAGATRMEWEAEPNALGFYERMGGRFLRDSEPTEWGRDPGHGNRFLGRRDRTPGDARHAASPASVRSHHRVRGAKSAASGIPRVLTSGVRCASRYGS